MITYLLSKSSWTITILFNMNIVYSSSDSYSELCGISITSVCENNKDVDGISFYVIDNGISIDNKKRLEKTVERYSRSIIFVPKIDLQSLTQTSIYVGRWNIGTFFRLYLASLLPKGIDRVAYIDCDTIIRHSLKDVYDIDLKDCVVAGVDDCRSGLYRIDINCQNDDLYVNNGFLIIDLQKMREEKLEDSFTQFISQRKGDCTYMDQAPLNGVLVPQGKVLELPAIYNAQRIFFDFKYQELLKLRRPSRCLSEDEYHQAVNDPVLVHFTPVFISGSRPWQKKDKHPFRNEYLMYKSISEWKDEPLRKDDRKLPKKIMTIVLKMMPRRLMIKIMSYLHAVWYPKKRIKISEKNR